MIANAMNKYVSTSLKSKTSTKKLIEIFVKTTKFSIFENNS
jgi:hypothetical protein